MFRLEGIILDTWILSFDSVVAVQKNLEVKLHDKYFILNFYFILSFSFTYLSPYFLFLSLLFSFLVSS